MGLYCSRIILFLKGQIEMDFLIERYNNWTKNPQNGENLFFAGFIIYMFWSIMRTTMFPHSSMAFNMCLVFSVLILAVKIVFFDVYTFKMFMAVAGMFACSAIVFVSSGYFWPFLWVLMLVSAKDVPFKKILQLYLLLNIIIMGLAFIAAMLGVIENLAYNSDNPNNDTLRYSFGCVYTTDFAAHIFFMLLTAYYLYQKKLRPYHYIGTCAIAGLIYYFCYAKLDTICILLMVLLFGGYHVLQWQHGREKIEVQAAVISPLAQVFPIKQTVQNQILLLAKDKNNTEKQMPPMAYAPVTEKTQTNKEAAFKRTRAYLRWKGIWGKIALISMPALTMLMYYWSASYKIGNEFLEMIDETITGRLGLGNLGIKEYGITLFGQDIPMIGMGGSTEVQEDYFFIDSSYLFILLRYGIIFLFIVFIVYGCICYKHRNDTVLMICITLLAISCFIDHHMMEEAYNPLGYALFAKAGGMICEKGKM